MGIRLIDNHGVFSQTEFASVSFYPNFVWFLSRDL